MEVPTSKKTKKPPKKVNHKGNIKFPKCLLVMRSISNKEKGRPPKRLPNLKEHSPLVTTNLNIKIACACCNTINTLYL
jgi:hypothetical protein